MCRTCQDSLGSKGAIEVLVQSVLLFAGDDLGQHHAAIADSFQALHFVCLMNPANVQWLATADGLSAIKTGDSTH